MNIFVTSTCPTSCAKALDDKRLVKMVLETAQLLSTCLRCTGDTREVLYKSTHVNHPCSVWTRRNIAHYSWLVDHFWALCEEYSIRFKKCHACAIRFNGGFVATWALPPPYFINCTPHKNLPVFEAYQLTLNEKWEADKANGRPPKWTNRGVPYFYKGGSYGQGRVD